MAWEVSSEGSLDVSKEWDVSQVWHSLEVSKVELGQVDELLAGDLVDFVQVLVDHDDVPDHHASRVPDFDLELEVSAANDLSEDLDDPDSGEPLSERLL